MVNRHRGEIDARLDGKSYSLCLTLGALAELEDAFGAEDMVALAARFETGRIRARDALRVIAAGLRGAGHDLTEADVAAMRADGGAGGYVNIVARLLRATFAADDESSGGGPAPPADELAAERDGGPGRPFPGTR